MARNQTVMSTAHNLFALNRVRKECYYEPIRVDFSPIQKPNNAVESIIPFFNNDRNYFTPAFVLKRQKTLFQENVLSEKNKFEARISHSEMLCQDETPQYKPTDSKYCQLCQEYFGDYWEHINNKYHKRMINSSKFNRDIVALCESFETQGKSKDYTKTKKIEKKKADRKPTKAKAIKPENNNMNQSPVKQDEEKLRIPTYGQKMEQQSVQENLQIKNQEQSLKIMLQLGNYSTNILSQNTFKQQLCQQS